MGRIPDEDVQRVRDATDVVQLISESVILKKKGRLFWGLCPFHGEKTPSFKVDPGTQLWHCFGCGEGGDSFGFLMASEHLEFPDAVRLLADRSNIEIREEGSSIPRSYRDRLSSATDAAAAFYHKVLLTAPEAGPATARDYLKGRGFGSDVAKRFELGYAPGRGILVEHLTREGYSAEELVDANLALRADNGRLRDRFYERVMFPIRDITGRAVGFGGRVIGSGEPKYLNTQETPVFHKSRNMYAIDRAKNPIVTRRHAIVVEGYTDVIALHEAGLGNAVATLGTALTRDHVKLLGRFASKIVYLFDADEAGLRAAERAAEFIDLSIAPSGGTAIELAVAVVPDGKDPADYVGSAGEAAMRAVVDEATPLLRFVLERRMTAYDLKSAEGRARALADAASVLVTVKGTFLGEEYVAYVAQRLRTSDQTVLSAVEHAKPAYVVGEAPGAPGEATSAPAQRPVKLGPPERAQRSLVGLVAAHPHLREKARRLLDTGLIDDPATGDLLGRLIDAGEAPGDSVVMALESSEPTLAQLLSGLLVDAAGNEDVDSDARELVHKLKEFALERQISEKKEQMNTLDPVKDRAAYDDIFKERSVLELRLGKMRFGEMEPDDDMKVWG